MSSLSPTAYAQLLDGLTIEGTPITRLYDQWQPHLRITLSPNAQALLLIDAETQRQVAWFFDGTSALIGCHIEAAISKRPLDEVLGPLDAAMRHLAAYSLSTIPEESTVTLPEASLALTLQMTTAWTVRHLSSITLKPATANPGASLLADTPPTGLNAEHLQNLLEARADTAPLIVLSPFDGTPLQAQIRFSISGHTVHRFHDATQNAAFYLSWPDTAQDQTPSFFCPTAGLILSDAPDPVLIPGRILAWYMTHPAHVETIRNAIPFDVGHALGTASSLASPPAPLSGEEARPAGTPKGTSRTAAWQFLAENAPEAGPTFDPEPEEPIQTTAKPVPPPDGLMGRLRGLMKRR